MCRALKPDGSKIDMCPISTQANINCWGDFLTGLYIANLIDMVDSSLPTPTLIVITLVNKGLLFKAFPLRVQPRCPSMGKKVQWRVGGMKHYFLLVYFLQTCQVLVVSTSKGPMGEALYRSTTNISATNWESQIKVIHALPWWGGCLLYTSDAGRRIERCRSRWSPYH